MLSMLRHLRGRIGALPHLLIASGLLTGAFLAVLVWMLLEARVEARSVTAQSLANLSTALARDIERTIEVYDLSLQAALRAVALPGVERIDPQLRHFMMFDNAVNARHLGALMVIDRTGQRLYESVALTPRTNSLAKREYFLRHRDDPSPDLYISAPFRRSMDNAWVLAISRRLSAPDGSFAGVVVGTLRLEYFQELTETLDLGPDGAVLVLRQDGTLVAREPWDDTLPGRVLADSAQLRQITAPPAGQVLDVSSIDGKRRLMAYRAAGSYPLVVVTSQSTDTVYAGWRRKALQTTLVVSVLLGLGCMLVLRLQRELWRRAEAERQARSNEAQFRLLAENSSDVILRTDLKGVRCYMSPSITQLLSYSPDELVGRHWTVVAHPDDHPIIEDTLARLRGGADHTEVTYRVFHKDGSLLWVQARSRLVRDAVTGAAETVVTVARDITAQKRMQDDLAEASRTLARQAMTDGLTELGNRRSFDEVLGEEWRRGQREEAPLSLLLLDVDLFKSYNDRYGHPMGDAALRCVADCIRANIRRPGDRPARYGGEEFAAILPQTDADGALVVAEAIRQAVADRRLPHERAGSGILTISIGVASAMPRQGFGPASLVEAADRALYEAKAQGRNRVIPAAPVAAEQAEG